jgi:hypothetical protein
MLVVTAEPTTDHAAENLSTDYTDYTDYTDGMGKKWMMLAVSAELTTDHAAENSTTDYTDGHG